jgi:eukaryotic-like serine/threonine-protein kinase
LVEPEGSGQVVGGRFRLIRPLGAGGMGQVWLAHDQGPLDREVALKQVQLPPHLTPHDRAQRIERAVREARNAARVSNHPNIVTVHEIISDDDAPWIVLEYVNAPDLSHILSAQGPRTPGEAARIGAAVVDGLAAVHQAGIVHRDIKPANILITDSGHVLLTDFGIAVLEADMTMTATGAVIATPEYMAPERARGEPAGPAADLFSLGAMLYEAVEGASPFHRDTAIATLTALLFEDPRVPERAGPLAPLLYDLLRKDPQQRPSLRDARARLAQIANTPTQVVSWAPPTEPAPPAVPVQVEAAPAPAPLRRYAAPTQSATSSGASAGPMIAPRANWTMPNLSVHAAETFVPPATGSPVTVQASVRSLGKHSVRPLLAQFAVGFALYLFLVNILRLGIRSYTWVGVILIIVTIILIVCAASVWVLVARGRRRK